MPTISNRLGFACGLTETVTLDPPPSGIKLFTAADRSTPASDLSWTETELPVMLYVEGVSPSGVLGDVELRATFTGEGGPCEDVLKLTVFTIAAEIVNQDDPTNDTWGPLGRGGAVYGGSEPPTADNVRLETYPSALGTAQITWSAEGPGGGVLARPGDRRGLA